MLVAWFFALAVAAPGAAAPVDADGFTLVKPGPVPYNPPPNTGILVGGCLGPWWIAWRRPSVVGAPSYVSDSVPRTATVDAVLELLVNGEEPAVYVDGRAWPTSAAWDAVMQPPGLRGHPALRP
jgi:hypothetical protein